MIPAKPTLLEKILCRFKRLIQPSSSKARTDDSLESLTNLYSSSMFDEGNFWHRFIIGRKINSIRVDEANLEELKLKATQGVFIYCTPNLGQLEYNVFHTIVQSKDLPLSLFNNALRVRRWLPFKKMIQSYRQRISYLSRFGTFPHPQSSGYLKNLILHSQSFTLSIEDWDPKNLSIHLQQLFRHLLEVQQEMEKPIFLIPMQLIWDKRPKRDQASIFEALFGEKEHPSQFRKILLFLRHYKKRAIVKFGKPISLKESLQPETKISPQELHHQILSSFEIEKRKLTGPPIRSRHWFLDKIMEDKNLAATLYEISKEKKKSIESVQRLALRYAKEIAADTHYSFVEFGIACLNWVFHHLFEDIFVDSEGLTRLKKTLSLGTTILVPNHRSHLDYLLLAYLCYNNDIVTPHVAAGINMSFWPLGSYFRRCGAFFLRQTFGANKPHKNVFQTPLQIFVREGYLQEFFIEGGRSRTGKLRNPKLGMLSMYSELLHEGITKDISFMPVSITYDRILEEKSYLEEVAGKPKEKEKTRDLLKLRKFLKGRYGSIYVQFDEPISWQSVSQEIEAHDWHEKKPKLVHALGQKILHAINRQVVATPKALAATALLSTPKRGILSEHVDFIFRLLLSYLQWKQVKISETLNKNPKRSLIGALNQFESSGVLKKHQSLEQNFFEIPPDKRGELDFFKNITIHYFVSLSLFSNLLLSRKKRTLTLEELKASYAKLQELFQYEFRFSTRRPIQEHLDKLCCYLQEQNAIKYDHEHIEILNEGWEMLKIFGDLLKNYLEAYAVTWKTYLLRPTLPNDEKSLAKAMLAHAKDQFILGAIQYPESISQETFIHAIQAFRALGFFSLDSNAAKELRQLLESFLNN